MVTKELIVRYHRNECSPEEKKLVEAWLSNAEHDIDTTQDKSDSEVGKQIWQALIPKVHANTTSSSHLFHKPMMKYAAAITLIIAVFFAGRLSVNTSYANTAKKQSVDHLHFSGANGAKGHLPGQNFKITVDGTIRLYNNSPMKKQIQVDGKVFTLTGMTEYYLTGTTENVRLLVGHQLEDTPMEQKGLNGGFTILRLDK